MINTGLLMAEINLTKEAQLMEQSDQINTELTKLTDEMKKIQTLLSWISQATDGNDRKKFDCTQDPEKMALIDELRQRDSTQHLIKQGENSWQGSALNNLVERLNGHINRTISPQMQQKMHELSHVQTQSSEILEILSATVKECKKAIDDILRKISQQR